MKKLVIKNSKTSKKSKLIEKSQIFKKIILVNCATLYQQPRNIEKRVKKIIKISFYFVIMYYGNLLFLYFNIIQYWSTDICTSKILRRIHNLLFISYNTFLVHNKIYYFAAKFDFFGFPCSYSRDEVKRIMIIEHSTLNSV